MFRGKTILVVLALCLCPVLYYTGRSNTNPLLQSSSTNIVVVLNTQYNNYFVQNGLPMGYHLELLNTFSAQTKIKFDIRLAQPNEKLDLLNQKQADLVLFSGSADSLYQLIGKHDHVYASIPLDEHIQSVWLSGSENNDLAHRFNIWMNNYRNSAHYRFLQVKYFKRTYNKSVNQLSQYDPLFKKHSSKLNWDWRLFASLVYQESMFQANAVSKHGAYGLMQLMPRTASHLGSADYKTPEGNIQTGVKLISELTRILQKDSIPESELTNFVLAAYNCGHGRLEDCRAVTKALGLNPNLWSDVRSVIPKMRNPSPDLLRHMPRGKFNGNETYAFVQAINDRYKHYQLYYQL